MYKNTKLSTSKAGKAIMNEIKEEIKQEAPDSYSPSHPPPLQPSSPSASFLFSDSTLPFQGALPFTNTTEYELKEPGAMYTCANCTREIYLTASSPIQCPSCEHLTGSSMVFYKIRTQATTYDTI